MNASASRRHLAMASSALPKATRPRPRHSPSCFALLSICPPGRPAKAVASSVTVVPAGPQRAGAVVHDARSRSSRPRVARLLEPSTAGTLFPSTKHDPPPLPLQPFASPGQLLACPSIACAESVKQRLSTPNAPAAAAAPLPAAGQRRRRRRCCSPLPPSQAAAAMTTASSTASLLPSSQRSSFSNPPSGGGTISPGAQLERLLASLPGRGGLGNALRRWIGLCLGVVALLVLGLGWHTDVSSLYSSSSSNARRAGICC
jgi:hypothetical protein